MKIFLLTGFALLNILFSLSCSTSHTGDSAHLPIIYLIESGQTEIFNIKNSKHLTVIDIDRKTLSGNPWIYKPHRKRNNLWKKNNKDLCPLKLHVTCKEKKKYSVTLPSDITFYMPKWESFKCNEDKYDKINKITASCPPCPSKNFCGFGAYRNFKIFSKNAATLNLDHLVDPYSPKKKRTRIFYDGDQTDLASARKLGLMEISPTRILWSFQLSLMPGLGLGYLIQNAWLEKGWMFTILDGLLLLWAKQLWAAEDTFSNKSKLTQFIISVSSIGSLRFYAALDAVYWPVRVAGRPHLYASNTNFTLLPLVTSFNQKVYPGMLFSYNF